MSKGLSTEFDINHRILGKLFGFPSCCIDFFVARVGTGFFQRPQPAQLRSMAGLRLCPICSEMSDEEIINNINSRRIAPTLFPTEPGPQHAEEILSNPAWTNEERMYLSALHWLAAPAVSVDEAAALDFYTSMTEVDAEYFAAVALEPERQPFFYAKRELAKNSFMAKLMDSLHAFMRERIELQRKGRAGF